MKRIKDIMSRYASFAWWIFMCLMMLTAMTGCILGMGRSVMLCCCGLFGSFISLLIFGWQAYGEWLEAREG